MNTIHLLYKTLFYGVLSAWKFQYIFFFNKYYTFIRINKIIVYQSIVK